MGRGNANTKQRTSTSRKVAQRKRPLVEEPLVGLSPEQARRFLAFKQENFRIEYVASPQRLRRAVKALEHTQSHGFDIETAAHRSWGVANGVPRLLQFGIDSPDRGPYQAVIDVRQVDPGPALKLLRDPDRVTYMQNYAFEMEWLFYHYGLRMRRPYDTMIASQEIRKTLKEQYHDAGRWEEAPEWAHQIYPNGWEKRDNNLATICEDTLGFRIPKAGLQDGDWGQAVLPARMIVYAAGDSALTLSAAEVLERWAAELGITERLAKRFASAPKTIYDRVKNSPKTMHDDSEGIILAMQRAKTLPELKRIQESGRQTAIYYLNRQRLQEVYQLSKARLQDAA